MSLDPIITLLLKLDEPKGSLKASSQEESSKDVSSFRASDTLSINLLGGVGGRGDLPPLSLSLSLCNDLSTTTREAVLPLLLTVGVVDEDVEEEEEDPFPTDLEYANCAKVFCIARLVDDKLLPLLCSEVVLAGVVGVRGEGEGEGRPSVVELEPEPDDKDDDPLLIARLFPKKRLMLVMLYSAASFVQAGVVVDKVVESSKKLDWNSLEQEKTRFSSATQIQIYA